MINISTNATLLLKFAIPIFWMIFFGSFTIAAWVVPGADEGAGPNMSVKIGLTLFFLGGVAFLYWGFLRLKRIEMDADFVYATNYFKTYRYPWHNIARIDEKDYLLFRTLHVYLNKPGKFGKKVYCVISQKRLNDFIAANPGVLSPFLEKEEAVS